MNPALQKYEAGIEENVKPEDKEAYDRIVTAGIKVITSDEFHQQLVDTLSVGAEELPDKIADGVARLISMLHVSSKGKMPVGPTIAAAYTLMVKAMDFAERALGAEITDDIIAETALKTISVVAPTLGIPKEKLQEAMQGQQSDQTTPQPSPTQPAQPAQPTGLMRGA
jgi:hypothetical protein